RNAGRVRLRGHYRARCGRLRRGREEGGRGELETANRLLAGSEWPVREHAAREGAVEDRVAGDDLAHLSVAVREHEIHVHADGGRNVHQFHHGTSGLSCDIFAVEMEHRRQAVALICVTLLLAGCSRGAKVCAVCQRDECKAMAFRITLDNGRRIETCCPRCGMHYLESAKEQPRRLEATDFATGLWMDAAHVTFVSGSDLRGCAMLESRRD